MTDTIPFTRRTYDMPDGHISALHFGPLDQPVQLVFLHANGFNGLTYRHILGQLGIHCIALDQRGHGMSNLPTDIHALKNWHVFARDLATFVKHYIDHPVILSGHSYGAVCAILAAPHLRTHVKGYIGFDPVSIPFLSRQIAYIPGGRALMRRAFPIAKNAGRRRFIFDNVEAIFSRYQGRGAFKGIPDAVLQDYVDGGLRPHADGVQLACHPHWEQAIFIAQGHNLYKAARDLPLASHVTYAGKGAVSDRFTRAALARKIGKNNVSFRPDFHHLFPLHHPGYARDALSAVIKSAG